jgi:hypothetical protein
MRLSNWQWLTLCIVMALVSAHAQTPVLASSHPGVEVTYTGSLYGYFRTDIPPSPAKDLIASFIQRGNSISNTGLLLGMGDNFAPEFGAGIQPVTVKIPGYEKCDLPPTIQYKHRPDETMPPGNLYKTGVRVAPHPYCDNVVDFLQQAGYRAVVPGRDDFGNGAEWLRKIGMDLRNPKPGDPPARNHDGKLNILAANVRIVPEAAKGMTVACPLLMSSYSLPSDPQTEQCAPPNPASGATEPQPVSLKMLQWLDTLIDDANQRASISKSTGCGEEPSCAPQGGFDQAAEDEREQLLAEETDAMLAMLQTEPRSATVDQLVCLLKELEGAADAGQGCGAAGDLLDLLDAALKAMLDARKDPASQDLLSYGGALEDAYRNQKNKSGAVLVSDDALRAGRRAILRSIWESEKEIGFTVATVRGQEEQSGPVRILVIAVMGQSIMKAVSPDNLLLCLNSKVKDAKANGEKIPAAGTAEESEGYMDCADPRLHDWSQMADVVTVNPVPTIVALLRALPLEAPVDRIVLMAQMKSNEASELETRVRSSLSVQRELERNARQAEGAGATRRIAVRGPDLILSGADTGHASQNFRMDLSDEINPTQVLTPYPAFLMALHGSVAGVHRPEATVRISDAQAPEQGTIIQNWKDDHMLAGSMISSSTAQRSSSANHGSETTEHLLLKALDDGKAANRPEIKSEDCDPVNMNPHGQVQKRCDLEVMHYVLGLMIARSHADVALLERNDFYLGYLPDGYTGYEVCEDAGLSEEAKSACQLEVAFGRVVWSGDDFDEVMVSGADLSAMIAKSQQESDAEEQLNAADSAALWLVSLGIVKQPASSLRSQDLSANQFTILDDPHCRGEGGSVYCVHGQPIQTDASYWVATSDHLADDSQVYPTLSAMPAGYLKESNRFMTRVLAEAVQSPHSHVLSDPQRSESAQQTRPLNHLDIAKWIAGFNWRDASGGDAEFGQFQGTADTRANTPYSQEIDLEMQLRAFHSWGRSSSGALTDLGYDRLVQGNLTGAIVNPSFPLNSFDAGIFNQIQIPRRFLPGPSWIGLRNFGDDGALAVATLQYQRQLTGTYLIVPFSQSSKGQLTQPLPAVMGFSGRIGVREEASNQKQWSLFDKGSYTETGLQFAPEWNVLKVAAFLNGKAGTATEEVVCDAAGTLTIANCIKTTPWKPFNPGNPANTAGANMTINSATTETIAMTNVLNWGAYWDIHLQKSLFNSSGDKASNINLQLDTKGDYFSPSSPALSTQSLFDLPITISASIPFLRNLSVTPSYTVFLFKAQNDRDLLFVNGVTMKFLWYFDRDSGVPFWRQLLFKGPASQSTTGTARMK